MIILWPDPACERCGHPLSAHPRTACMGFWLTLPSLPPFDGEQDGEPDDFGS